MRMLEIHPQWDQFFLAETIAMLAGAAVLAFGILASFAVVIINAWVLLVEIVR